MSSVRHRKPRRCQVLQGLRRQTNVAFPTACTSSASGGVACDRARAVGTWPFCAQATDFSRIAIRGRKNSHRQLRWAFESPAGGGDAFEAIDDGILAARRFGAFIALFFSTIRAARTASGGFRRSGRLRSAPPSRGAADFACAEILGRPWDQRGRAVGGAGCECWLVLVCRPGSGLRAFVSRGACRGHTGCNARCRTGTGATIDYAPDVDSDSCAADTGFRDGHRYRISGSAGAFSRQINGATAS